MNGAPRWVGGALLACTPAFGGCIASNVVAPEARMVAPRAEELAFTAAPQLVLDGLFESIDIRGDAAVSLRKIYYLFSANGTYTAAALADAEGVPSFQTLNGTWTVGPDGLALDGEAPVRLEQAEDHLRLSAPTGQVVLRRSRVQ